MNDTTAHTPDNDQTLDFLRQIQTQQRRGDEENGVLRNIYKRAGTAGEHPEILRLCIKLLKKLSPEEIVGYLREVIRVLNIRRIEINAGTLFDGMMLNVTEKSQQEDALFDAGTEGYKAGRNGLKIDDAPYLQGSEFFAEWVRNWHRGQAAIARELGPDSRPANATRTRPKRGGNGSSTETDDEPAEQAPRKAAAKKAAAKKAAPKKAAKKNGGKAPRKKAAAAPAPDNMVDLHPADHGSVEDPPIVH